MLENLLSLSPNIATSLLSPKSAFLDFLLKRIGADKLPSDRDQNRFYAGELLSILLGVEVEGIKEGRKRLAGPGVVDGLLRLLSVRSALAVFLLSHADDSDTKGLPPSRSVERR